MMEKYVQSVASKEISSSSSDEHQENTSNKRKKKCSDVWNFFKPSQNKRFAKCRYCGREYKTSGNTSNLFDHLRRVHPNFKKGDASENKIDSYFQKSELYGVNSIRRKNIDNALMWMVAIDVQPFRVVEDEGFRQFVKCLDPRYTLPSRTTLQNVLMKNAFDETQKKLQVILTKIQHCAITTDCWTSRGNENYLTVTCHFILEENFKLRVAVLSTQKLLSDTNHSAENISESLHHVLSEWSILHKVIAIVTDNAPSMIKACELLQKRHVPCFAHSLNLVVQDALAQENIKPILAKCKRIVTYFKSSTIAYEKFKAAQGVEKPYSLLQEVQTRWNSAYLMIKRVLVTKDSISKVLLSTSKAPTPLTADEVLILTDLCELLAPFYDATLHTSANSSVTISLVIPLSFGLYRTLNDLKRQLKTSDGLNLCSFLMERLKIRLFHYENRTVTKMATILDARFKKEGVRSPSIADIAVKALEDEIASKQRVSSSNQQMLSNTQSKPCEQPLLRFLNEKIDEKVKSNRVDAIISIRHYLERPNAPQSSNPLDYWKSNENDSILLSTCANLYFCIPATSTESERTFSKAGLIISDRRSALKAKNVNTLIFLNKNKWVIDEP